MPKIKGEYRMPDLSSGKCTDIDDDAREDFFPGEGHDAITRGPRGRKLCDGCPVREACLDYALHVQVYGTWGGTNYRERQRMRKARGIVGLSLSVESYFGRVYSEEGMARLRSNTNQYTTIPAFTNALDELEGPSLREMLEAV